MRTGCPASLTVWASLLYINSGHAKTLADTGHLIGHLPFVNNFEIMLSTHDLAFESNEKDPRPLENCC